jgi:hypothetical protein
MIAFLQIHRFNQDDTLIIFIIRRRPQADEGSEENVFSIVP